MLSKKVAFLYTLGLTLTIVIAAPFDRADAKTKNRVVTPPAPYDQSYQDLNEALQKFIVVNGAVSQVDYKKLRANQIKLLAHLKNTSAVSQKTYDTFSEKEKIAFLINAYNAFTLKLVLDNYPVKSIKKIGSIFKTPWKLKFFRLLGVERSLDDVEHNMLRKDFSEPRVHFAINCASVGCPGLRNEPYTADKLDAQLTDQATQFLRDGVRNVLDPAGKKLKVSMIFKWFDEDFKKNGSTVQKFVSQFITDDPLVKKDLEADAYELSYTDYDWDINEAKH